MCKWFCTSLKWMIGSNPLRIQRVIGFCQFSFRINITPHFRKLLQRREGELTPKKNFSESQFSAFGLSASALNKPVSEYQASLNSRFFSIFYTAMAKHRSAHRSLLIAASQ